MTFLLLIGGAIAISMAAVSMASRAQAPPRSQLRKLDEASFEGNAVAVKRILSQSGPSHVANVQDSQGRTPLMAAAQGGHLSVIKELISAGANVNEADKQGWTPLMAAAGAGHARAARLLLLAGASPNAANRSGRTALMGAAFLGHQGAIRELLDKGADPNLQDGDGWTAVRWAAKGGHAGAVALLASFGANPDMRDWNGWTPIMAAALSGADASVIPARALPALAAGLPLALRPPPISGGGSCQNAAAPRAAAPACNPCVARFDDAGPRVVRPGAGPGRPAGDSGAAAGGRRRGGAGPGR